jgi:hypothetical protein
MRKEGRLWLPSRIEYVEYMVLSTRGKAMGLFQESESDVLYICTSS